MKKMIILVFCTLIYASIQSQTPVDLVPLTDATHTAQISGDWSNPITWGGEVPTNGARVVIPNGLTITVDIILPNRIKTIRLDGKLNFKNNVNTLLKVETIIGLPSSELEIGTSQNPIQNGVTATIIFIDEGAIDLNWDYNQFSKGMVMMGATNIYGAEKTSWSSLSGFPVSGSNSIQIDKTPINWKIGDELVITGTDPFNPSSDEKRIISGINGDTISLNFPLSLNHVSIASDLKVHVANLSRNVIFKSENSSIARRGHVMFMHNNNVSVNFARFFQLGRTNKRVQIDDWYFPTLDGTDAVPGPRTNIRGRYSVHFHRGGVSPSQTPLSTINSCVVEDDPGWAYVNHSSHVAFQDNVSYNVVGGAFQTESGDEIGSFTGNIAIRTVNPDFPLLNPLFAPVDIRENSQDFAFQGDGFWIHGGRVSVDNNIASGCSGHGFIYWTEGLREPDTGVRINQFLASNLPNGEHLPLGACNTWWAPIISFKGNISYSATKGFSSFYIHSSLFDDYQSLSSEYLETVRSNLEDFTAWNIRSEAMDLNHNERVNLKNIRLENDFTINPEAVGITNDYMNREMVYKNLTIRGFEVGLQLPTRGNITILGGVFGNAIDFNIIPVQLANMPFYTRDMRFDCIEFESSSYFPSPIHFNLLGSQFFEGTVGENFENLNRSFLVPDRITVNTALYGEGQLYFNEQDSEFIPITRDNIIEATGSYAVVILNKTNSQLQSELNMSFAGAITPSNAVTQPGIQGGKISTTYSNNMNYPNCMYMNESILNFKADFFDDYSFYSCWDSQSQDIGGTTSSFNHITCSNLLVNTPNNGINADCMTIYPNPTNDIINFKENLIHCQIYVLDIKGRIVKEIRAENEFTSINLGRLSRGVYILKIQNELTNSICSKRVIIQ